MTFNIRVWTFAILALSWLWLFAGESTGQVTFSRDWKAGKRMIENAEFRNTLKTATSVCHLLIAQVRQLAVCENRDDLDPGVASIFNDGQ